MVPAEVHTGINLTPEKLQLVEIEKISDKLKLINIAESNFGQQIDFINQKDTEIIEIIQSVFKPILQKKNLGSKSISFTLPAELFYFYRTPNETSLMHNDLLEEFRWQLSIVYPYINMTNLAIQYIELKKNPVVKQDMALVVALPRKYLLLLKTFCEINRFQLKYVDAVNLAAEKSIKFCGVDPGVGITASIYKSEKIISLILSSEGKIFYNSFHEFSDEQDSLNFIREELKPSKLKKINRNVFAKVYLTGENINNEYSEKLKVIVNQPPVIFNPFKSIGIDSSIENNELVLNFNNSFSAASGVAYRIAG